MKRDEWREKRGEKNDRNQIKCKFIVWYQLQNCLTWFYVTLLSSSFYIFFSLSLSMFSSLLSFCLTYLICFFANASSFHCECTPCFCSTFFFLFEIFLLLLLFNSHITRRLSAIALCKMTILHNFLKEKKFKST